MPKYLHDMSKEELIAHIEKMQEYLAEIHRLEEENKELGRVNKVKHELYQEQKNVLICLIRNWIKRVKN